LKPIVIQMSNFEQVLKDKNISKEQLEALKELTEKLCAKYVKKYLLDLADYQAKKLNLIVDSSQTEDPPKLTPEQKQLAKTYRALVKKIQKIPASDFVGYQELTLADNETFNDDMPTAIRFQLSMVKADHSFDFKVEEKLIKPLLAHLDKFVQLVCSYYLVILKQYNLAENLAELFPNEDTTKLHVHKFTRTMHIVDAFDSRLGIVAYYVDASGNKLELDE